MKLQVRDEFVGRSGPCPACKQTLVVPPPQQAIATPVGQINGTPSSLHQAGLNVGVTLDAPRGTKGEQEAESYSPVSDLLAGRTRTGSRYVVDREIARGGMGAVVRAVDSDIRREVAVKYMLSDGDAAQKARFIEEAQITGQLEHPNIVPIHELGVDAERRLFFAMKMVKGRSLAQVLDELRKNPVNAEKKWSLARLLTIMTNICYALSYAHSRGVIHRDLKPANIMLGDFGETYVMDWGLAKVVGCETPPIAAPPEPASPSEFTIRTKGKSPSASSIGKPNDDGSGSGTGSSSSKVSTSRELEGELTQEGAVLGTPAYMAPEQARGETASLDNRSDIYSLGAILYEMLTLLSPVEKGGGPMAMLVRVANGEIQPPETRAPDRAKAGKIPKELAAVAMKALALKPADRYQSADGLRRDIERFQEGRSVSAKHDTPVEAAVKFVKRNKGFSAATGVGAVTLATVLAVAFNVNYAARVQAEGALVLAQQNYDAFQSEQKAKNDAIRNSIPGTLRAARQLADDGALDDALKQIALVRQYEPNNRQAALLRGQILTAQHKFADALAELAFYLQRNGQDRDALTLYALARYGKGDNLQLLYAAADALQRQKLFHLTPLLLKDAAKLLEAKNPLVDLYQKQMKEVLPKAGLSLRPDGEIELNLGGHRELIDLNALRGMQLNRIGMQYCEKVADIDALRGMPLSYLFMGDCYVIPNLEALRGAPLKYLSCHEAALIHDLEPLRGMPLEELYVSHTAVGDLEPLRGMQLRRLNVRGCPVSDLSPLAGMPLEFLSISGPHIRDLEPLRGMSLTELELEGCTNLTQLEPLRGMPCVKLLLNFCVNVESLEPLRGMPCKELRIAGTQKVKSLEPLRGMPLQKLYLQGSGTSDLTPLADIPLVEIEFTYERITSGLEVLRNKKSLLRIVSNTVAFTPTEFWKRYDAGEFKK